MQVALDGYGNMSNPVMRDEEIPCIRLSEMNFHCAIWLLCGMHLKFKLEYCIVNDLNNIEWPEKTQITKFADSQCKLVW